MNTPEKSNLKFMDSIEVLSNLISLLAPLPQRQRTRIIRYVTDALDDQNPLEKEQELSSLRTACNILMDVANIA